MSWLFKIEFPAGGLGKSQVKMVQVPLPPTQKNQMKFLATALAGVRSASALASADNCGVNQREEDTSYPLSFPLSYI